VERVPRARTLLAAAAVLIGAATFTASASAKTIDVKPKRPGAIQKAIDDAARGDTLRIHEGRYIGAISVDKKLTLKRAKGEKRPVIDGGCETAYTVDVDGNGVTFRGLKVVGAAEGFGPFPSAVNLIAIETGVIDDLVVRNTCGSAEYGINVFQGGHIEITDNSAEGFHDAGVYVGAIQDTSRGPLIVAGNVASGNNRGVIVEDSFGVDIRVIDNELSDNGLSGVGTPSGIFVHNSDGTLIRENVTNRNGDYGIHLDGGSDNTLLVGNVAKGNGTSNFFDEGSGNCGSKNSFTLPAC
jgi:parallel beta-helix repeat protein